MAAAGAADVDDAYLTRTRAFEKRAQMTIQPLVAHFPWPTILTFVGACLGVIGVAALAVTGYLSWWVAIPVNAILIYFVFTPMHEAVHGNIARGNPRLLWLEVLIGHAGGFLLLAPYSGFRALHLHHHANTNDPDEDPDYWVKSPTWIGQLMRSLVIQPVYILHLWKIARDPHTRRAFAWEMVYLAIYAAIVAAAFRFGVGKEMMLLWILPGYIGMVMCPVMFDWPVHHPHSERGRYADSAILLFPPPFQRIMDFVFCGHSYHLMHHLYPRLPFYHYGTAWDALKDELSTLQPKVREFSL
jgi:beta-carotene hydroxylase